MCVGGKLFAVAMQFIRKYTTKESGQLPAPPLSSHKLPVVPQGGMGPDEPHPICDKMLTSPILCMFLNFIFSLMILYVI